MNTDNFRTVIVTKEFPFTINHKDPITSTGSCFSDHLGQRMQQLKFNILTNPFGVIFNPIPLFRSLELSLTDADVEENHIIERHGYYHHLSFHSDVTETSKEGLIESIESKQKATKDQIGKSKHLILTLGTAFGFRYHQSGRFVANCHRLPSDAYEKGLISVEDINESFDNLYRHLPEDINIILTVSPVRHLKDTLEGNSLSKSTLIMASHQLARRYNNVFYFPSYEMLIDDLRDYRFYNQDMIHPTPQAVDYIFDHFSNAFFDQNTAELTQSIHQLQKSMAHRPRFLQSPEYYNFLNETLKKAEVLDERVDLSDEISHIQGAINRYFPNN